MTRNPVDDSEQFSATFWSAIVNGIAQEAIVSGCTPSKGSGDFDVDIASGEALVQGDPVSVSSQTVTLSSSDSSDRVDIITVDSNGNASATGGTPATDPIAPSIPSGEVLITAVLIPANASSLNAAGAKIADYRTIRDKRIQSVSSETRVANEAGNNAVVANDSSYHRFIAQSSTPIQFRDAVGGISAGEYTPGASAPNTWDWGGHDFTNINSLSTDELSNGSGLTDSQISLATQTPIVEDWERQTLSYYGGDTSNFAFDNSTVLQGSASVRVDTGSANLTLRSPFVGRRGFRYRSYIRFDSHGTQDVQFIDFAIGQTQGSDFSSDDGYSAFVDKNSEEIGIRRWDSGSQTKLASESSLSITTDGWIVIEWDVEYEDITLDVKDLSGTSELSSPLSANDTTYQSNGFVQVRGRSDDVANSNYTYFDEYTRRPL